MTKKKSKAKIKEKEAVVKTNLDAKMRVRISRELGRELFMFDDLTR